MPCSAPRQLCVHFSTPSSSHYAFLITAGLPVYNSANYSVGGARFPQATVIALLAAEARTITK